MTWLNPIPGLKRDDPSHTYNLAGAPFPISITGVLRIQKSDLAMARIQATQAIWAPRGNSTHRALELSLRLRFDPLLQSGRSSDRPEVIALVSELSHLRQGDYAEWINPLLDHPIWSEVTVIASERATCCTRRGIAGTFDTAFLHPALEPSPDRPAWVTGPARVLADLKTLGSATTHTYSVAAQLGGYAACEATHGHWYDYGMGIWARPGSATLGPLLSRRECLIDWAAAWTRYQAHCKQSPA